MSWSLKKNMNIGGGDMLHKPLLSWNSWKEMHWDSDNVSLYRLNSSPVYLFNPNKRKQHIQNKTFADLKDLKESWSSERTASWTTRMWHMFSQVFSLFSHNIPLPNSRAEGKTNVFTWLLWFFCKAENHLEVDPHDDKVKTHHWQKMVSPSARTQPGIVLSWLGFRFYTPYKEEIISNFLL